VGGICGVVTRIIFQEMMGESFAVVAVVAVHCRTLSNSVTDAHISSGQNLTMMAIRHGQVHRLTKDALR
jgi:hypothetical protein